MVLHKRTLTLGVAIIASALLAGCTSFLDASPESQIIQAEQTYNVALTELVAGRTTCVADERNPEFGPEHPLCLIDDDLYRKIEPVRATANGCLDDAKALIAINPNAPNLDAYLSCASGSAAALLDYLTQ